MKKKIICMLLAVFMVTGCGSTPELSNGDDALVTLKDGTQISANEIWDEVKETYALDIVLNKIDTKMLEEKFKDKKKEIDEYVDSYVATLKANYPTEEELNNALAQYGYNDLEKYKESVRLSYLQELATKEYAKKKVTEKEIKDYYKNKTKGDINCVHVLVKPTDTSDGALKEAETKAKEIIKDINKQVNSGKKPSDVFNSYKDNKDVTFEDLGYFNVGQMEGSFEDAAYALKEGKYTKKPVKTSYGYHVILKLDEKEKEKLKEVKEDITEKIATEKIQEDNTLSTKSMIDLRKNNGFKFYDEKIEQAYNKYMNYLLNQNESE